MKAKQKNLGTLSQVLLIICVFISTSVWAEDNYDLSAIAPTGQTIYYKIANGEATIVYPHVPSVYYGENGWTGYEKPSGDLRMPATILYNGVNYPVTYIGRYAFQDCEDLLSVAISNSVVEVGEEAFSGCIGLTSVTMPDYVFIGSRAFYGCTSLSSFVFPDEITDIEEETFYGCTGLVSVHLPNSLKKIKASAFSGCTGLTSVEIPQSEEYYSIQIGEQAFMGCTSIRSVSFSESVTKIGNAAFTGCTGLTSIEIFGSSIGEQAFMGCANLESIVLSEYVSQIGKDAFVGTKWYNNQTDGVLCLGDWCLGYKGEQNGATLQIPNGIRNISEKAFYGCSNIVAVSMPNSIERIGSRAFYLCDGLISIDFSNSLYSIGEYAFYGCKELTNIHFPNSLNYIGFSSFFGCSSLTNINIPNSVTYIEGFTFCGCSGLTNISFPSSLTRIEGYAFSGCGGLTTISFPSSLTSIGDNAFSGCNGLNSIYIPNTLSSIGEAAFVACDGLASIVVDSGNSKYDSRNNCNAIIETETNNLISGCKNTIIPVSVTSIGNRAFWGCHDLSNIVFPFSLSSIGKNAFIGCDGLVSITTEALVPPSCIHDEYDYNHPYNPFLSNDILLYVPCGYKEVYANADYWKDFVNIIDIEAFFNINISSSDENLGNARVVQQPNCENNVATVLAEPIGDHPFLNWTKNGQVVSTANPYTFVVDSTVCLVANFKGTGVDEEEMLKVSVSPNPTNDKIVVICEDMSNIVMFAPDGRKVQTLNVKGSGEIEMDLSGLSNGLYILRIETNNSLIINKKVIIQ